MTSNTTMPAHQAAEGWISLIYQFRFILATIDEITATLTAIPDVELSIDAESRTLLLRRYLCRRAAMEALIGFIAEWRQPHCTVCWDASRNRESAKYLQELHRHLPNIADSFRRALDAHQDSLEWIRGSADGYDMTLRYDAATREDVRIFLDSSSGFKAWSRIHP